MPEQQKKDPEEAAVAYLLELLETGNPASYSAAKLEACRLLLSMNRATPIPGGSQGAEKG